MIVLGKGAKGVFRKYPYPLPQFLIGFILDLKG